MEEIDIELRIRESGANTDKRGHCYGLLIEENRGKWDNMRN